MSPDAATGRSRYDARRPSERTDHGEVRDNGYGDQQGYDRTAPAVRDLAHTRDAELRAGGAEIGVAGVPVQVRNHDATDVVTSSGPYLRSDLPVAGFMLVEAATLTEAVELVSRTPCAVSQGVVEVWPLLETPPADPA